MKPVLLALLVSAMPASVCAQEIVMRDYAGRVLGGLWKVSEQTALSGGTVLEARFEMSARMTEEATVFEGAAQRLCQEQKDDLLALRSTWSATYFSGLKVVAEWRLVEVPEALAQAMPEYVGPKKSFWFDFGTCEFLS